MSNFRVYDSGTKTCNCIDTYYNQGTTKTCLPCLYHCATCTNGTKCATCNEDNYR